MRIGYFGGSFDPPHCGHLAVARAAATHFELDRVLFVPSGSQPLKPQGATAPYADRFAMTALLCAGGTTGMSCTTSDLESPHRDGTPHYTVDTLRRLRASLATGDSLFVIVGADAFLDLRRWREPGRLLELAEWVVVSRPGSSLSQLQGLHLTREQTARVHRLDALAEPASGTLIRERLAVGDPCTDVLPSDVFEYIRRHHLYGT